MNQKKIEHCTHLWTIRLISHINIMCFMFTSIVSYFYFVNLNSYLSIYNDNKNKIMIRRSKFVTKIQQMFSFVIRSFYFYFDLVPLLLHSPLSFTLVTIWYKSMNTGSRSWQYLSFKSRLKGFTQVDFDPELF